MPKDFAKSYAQKSWEFAVERHARMNEWLRTVDNPRMIPYAKETIAAIEKRYPSLKAKG